MNRRRGDSKVALDISFCRRTAIDFGVVIDESKVLTLFFGICTILQLIKVIVVLEVFVVIANRTD
jgi:hypothetical protein